LKAIWRFLLQEAKENTGKQDRGLKEKKLHQFTTIISFPALPGAL
jgi:hypothetical protein